MLLYGIRLLAIHWKGGKMAQKKKSMISPKAQSASEISEPSSQATSTSSPSTKLHFMAASRYAASEERVRQFASDYPGDLVVTMNNPRRRERSGQK